MNIIGSEAHCCVYSSDAASQQKVSEINAFQSFHSFRFAFAPRDPERRKRLHGPRGPP
jgi:hypothetical protein